MLVHFGLYIAIRKYNSQFFFMFVFLLLVCVYAQLHLDEYNNKLAIVDSYGMFYLYIKQNQSWVFDFKMKLHYTPLNVITSNEFAVVLGDFNGYYLMDVIGKKGHLIYNKHSFTKVDVFNYTIVTNGVDYKKQIRVIHVYEYNGTDWTIRTLEPSLNPENTCDGDIRVNQEWMVTSCYNDLDYWVVVYRKINAEWVMYRIIRHLSKIITLKLYTDTLVMEDMQGNKQEYILEDVPLILKY